MNLTIKDRFGEFSEKNFKLADGEGISLTVSLSESFSKVGTFFLSVKAGEKVRTFGLGKARDGIEITIPSTFLKDFCGNLEFSLVQRSEDGTITINDGAYVIEPLFIERLEDGTFYGTAQYQAIKAELEDLKKAYDRERFAREDAEKAFATLQSNIVKRDEERDDKARRLYEMMEIIVQDRYHISLAELAKENGIKGV